MVRRMVGKMFQKLNYVDQIDWMLKHGFLREKHMIVALCESLNKIDRKQMQNNPVSLQKLADFCEIEHVACSCFIFNTIAYYIKTDPDKATIAITTALQNNSNKYMALYCLYFNIRQNGLLDSAALKGFTYYELRWFASIIRGFNDKKNEFIVLKFCYDNHMALKPDDIKHLHSLAQEFNHILLCIDLVKRYPDLVKKGEEDLVLAKLYVKGKMFSYAKAIAEKHLSKNESMTFYNLLIDLLIKMNKLEEAADWLEKAKQSAAFAKKQDANIWYHSALLNYRSNKLRAALRDSFAGLLIKPKDIKLLAMKTKLLGMLGITTEALEAAKELHALKPNELHFDLLLNFLAEKNALPEKAIPITLVVDACAYPNIDELLSNYTAGWTRAHEQLMPFEVTETVFILNKEPDYLIPPIASACRMVLYPEQGLAQFVGEWLPDASPDAWHVILAADDMADFFTQLPNVLRPGQREGIIAAGRHQMVRSAVLADFLPYFLSRQPFALQDFHEALREHFFIRPQSSPDGAPEGLEQSEPSAQPSVEQRRLKAVFIGPSGASARGGGEQFIRSISFMLQEHFNAEIDIISLSPTESFDEKTQYLGEDAQGIRRAIYAIQPDIIWCLSVENMACIRGAIAYHKALTIVGLHFYRALVLPGIDNLFAPLETLYSRDSFTHLLRQVDYVYCNSLFLQRMAQKRFLADLPVVYSLPHLTLEAPTPVEERDYVLMCNASWDKGFGIFLRCAELLPDIPFVVCCNMSNYQEAEEMCRLRGLTNVTALPFQEDMTRLYAKAKVVLVPSFDVIETFSRVCVEGQAHGVPVIGADAGNIPYILRDSGIVLPKDERLWAEAIEQLYADPDYYARMSRQALENAESRYAFGQQKTKVERMLAYAGKRIIVGLGSGLGNMVLASPVIKKLSEHFGAPVDILVTGVPEGSTALFANNPYVNAVYQNAATVRTRYYDIVFLTRSTSAECLQLCFNADRIYRTRDVFDYIDYRSYHETEVELAALKRFLGIPYNAKDLFDFIIGGNPYRPAPRPRRIGLHAGCKNTKKYAKKRWPHFEALAYALQCEDFEVCSLGTQDEHIVGTVNCTQSTVWDLMDAIATCDYVVSNDSGIGHIAKALGIPGTVLFGPTYSNKLVPYAENWQVIHTHSACAPCLYSDKMEHCDEMCMQKISVEQVLASIHNHYSTRQPGASQ
jgi:ADP-heptose:LPS heptosyltransferase/glycosyltransferase involved in cell wall biosynthesis